MARLTDGCRLGALRIVRPGALVIAGKRARPAGVLRALWFAAGLYLGARWRESGAVARALTVGGVWSAVRARSAPAGAGVRPAAWRSGAGLAGVAAGSMPEQVEKLLIVPCLRGADVAAPSNAAGPGPSAGESAYQLPAAWADWPMPDNYIGDAVSMLALVRGESWAVGDAGVLVGGRLLVDQYGTPYELTDDGAARWVSRQLLTAEKMLGVVWMASGPAKVIALSDMRRAAWSDVRKRAKSIAGVVDSQVRAALIADLDFLQRAV